MRGRAGEYIRGNLLGMVAIFIALGGVAWGASNKPKLHTAPKDSVVSKSIKDGQVKSSDLGGNSVSAANVKNGSLSGAELGADSVTGKQIDESSLGSVSSADDAATLGGKPPSGFIQNRDSGAQNANIAVSGYVFGGSLLTTPGMLRTGNEAGTDAYPVISNGEGSYAGVVIRRVNSSFVTSAGDVIARTDLFRLESDGTSAGLQLAWDPADAVGTVACQGVSGDGSPIAVANEVTLHSDGRPGVLPIVSNASNPVLLDCQFGDADNFGHTTEVRLLRRSHGDDYIGFVLSTVNQ